MINTTYWGTGLTSFFATDSKFFLGQSALLTRSKIRLNEGYNYGTSTEYINKGLFYVDRFTNGGFDNERLSISATSAINEPSFRTNFFRKEFVSAVFVTDLFKDNSWSSNYSVDYQDGVVLGSTQTFSLTGNTTFYRRLNATFYGTTEPNLSFKIRTSTIPNISDQTVLCRSHGMSSSTTVALGSTYSLWLSFRSPTAGNGYVAVWDKTSNSVLLNLLTPEGQTTLSSVSGITINSLTIGNKFDFVVKSKRNNIQVLGSTDLANYTKYIDLYDDTYTSGVVELGMSAFVGLSRSLYNIEQLSIWEDGQIYNQEDIIKEAYTMCEVGVTFAKNQNYPTNNEHTYGSCWIRSNNTFTRSGTSSYFLYDCFTIFDPEVQTFTNSQSFVFECDIRGLSGSAGGIGGGYLRDVGATSFQYFGDIFYFGVTKGHNMVFHDGTTTFTSRLFTSEITLLPDVTYKLRFVNNRGNLITYVNDQKTSTFYSNIKSQTYVEFAMNDLLLIASSGNGISVSFINPRMSVANKIVNKIALEPNEKISSLISRASFGELTFSNLNGTAEVFAIGMSRQIWFDNGVTHIFEESQTLRNALPKHIVKTIGTTFAVSIGGTWSRTFDTTIGNIEIGNEGTEENVDDTITSLYRRLTESHKERETVTTTQQTNPCLQVGDILRPSALLPYDESGIAYRNKERLVVDSFTRNYASSGSATDSINLVSI